MSPASWASRASQVLISESCNFHLFAVESKPGLTGRLKKGISDSCHLELHHCPCANPWRACLLDSNYSGSTHRCASTVGWYSLNTLQYPQNPPDVNFFFVWPSKSSALYDRGELTHLQGVPGYPTNLEVATTMVIIWLYLWCLAIVDSSFTYPECGTAARPCLSHCIEVGSAPLIAAVWTRQEAGHSLHSFFCNASRGSNMF